MSELSPVLLRRLRWSGLFLAIGLVFETATLFWTHPLAFIFFVAPGAALVGLGMLLFLYAVVSS